MNSASRQLGIVRGTAVAGTAARQPARHRAGEPAPQLPGARPVDGPGARAG